MNQPLPLARIRRLLRPLRSSLASLLASVALATIRSNDVALHCKRKGKEPALEDDADDASPFQAKRRHLKTAQYGARGSKAQMQTSAAPKAPTGKPLDLRGRLLAGGMDSEVVLRVVAVVQAYRNVLECVYGVEQKGKGKGREDAYVASLLDICSREVGWGIEDSVRTCLDEAGGGVGTGMMENEDGQLLADEWYDACPSYCARRIFVQHATAIVLDHLHASTYTILEPLYDLCMSLGAYTEAARFYSALSLAGLASETTEATAFSVGLHAQSMHHLPTFIRDMTMVLVSSSFASRLFYSPFLSLTSIRMEDADAELVIRLLEMECDIANEMLSSIAGLEDGDDSSESLAHEVVVRIDKEVKLGITTLLRINTTEVLSDIATSLFDLISAHPIAAYELLSPLSSLLELAILSTTTDATVHLSRLSHLSSIDQQVESTHHSSPFSSRLCSALSPLLKILTTQSIALISTYLHDASLFHLEGSLLANTLERYDQLTDVRTMQGTSALSKDSFSERLTAAEEGCIVGGGTDTSGWRYEEMIGSYVVATPAKALQRQEMTKVGDSPLANESLGRPFRLARGRERSSPMKRMQRLRARFSLHNKRVELDQEEDDEEEQTVMASSSPGDKGRRNLDALDLTLVDSESDTDGGVVYVDSGSSSDEDELNIEILEEEPQHPVEFTSEMDDLDLLSASVRDPPLRMNTKRRRYTPPLPLGRRVRFSGMEESDDELAM